MRLAEEYFKDEGESGLKFRTDFLLSYGLVSRGDNIRNLKFSTIGVMHFPREGVSGATLLRCVWKKSKKNQFGKFEQTAIMRYLNY
jgi:hypothetical protein